MDNKEAAFMKFYKIICITSVFLFIAVIPLMAVEMFAKTDNVKVFSSSSAGSKVLKILKKNDSVNAGQKKGRFVYVETFDKKFGWVFEFSLKSTAPAKKKSSDKFLDSLTTDNYASRDSSTKANVRGLTEISKQYAANNKITEKTVETAEKMEKYKIPVLELDLFLKQGRLGEYVETEDGNN